VLFSAQKSPEERWQVWEMDADGSNKRQVTSCTEYCLRAAYLPGDEIVYTVVSRETGRPGSYLAVAKRDGSEAHRITFGPGDFQVEMVLRDGRILASASWPLLPTDGTAQSRELYTLQPDGTGLDCFRCGGSKAATAGDAEEMDDGSILFIKSWGAGSVVGGDLAEVKQGATRDASVGSVKTMCWSPRRLAPGELVVARWVPGVRGATGKFDLYAFDLNRGSFGERIYGDAKLSSIQAVPVTPGLVPKILWSTLDPQAKAGYFICLDSYLSATGRQDRLTAPIARVRVLTLDTAGARERTLGDAPVEQDGSFYVAVPADQPIRFELLGSDGRTVQAQKSWMWSRPGEEHGCAGCHEDRAVAPENRWPMTLKRFDTPTQLGMKDNAPTAH
jgi:hypothetical protein